jgi:putative phosphoesterase
MTNVARFDARKVAILGDCHIHPGKGLDWPATVLRALSGTDLIVTLGDMGETQGLDRLAAIAPVIGVRGRDDGQDARTGLALRVLQLGEQRIGCVFDPVEHGLASQAYPFTPVPNWIAKASALFGGPIQILLHASTHRAHTTEIDDILILDPGSALLPADGTTASLAVLTIDDGKPQAEIVSFG